ncbi:dUTP diphosphatase [Caulobacter mirabilis]|uniref:Deoxyuridine 5'-triphosphate nucleotidohydrolase n=1 Tax=Caulobacter mirabilis TaxID=69666 RepID=A0A2D2ASZ3_9CAUL|nr:dUTP diphosphatase [Caulobacter mirabilis]ATQ41085.1 dUTP diphosphatase [Caulobacter mirabilis]
MTPTIPVTRLPHAEGIPLPAYETALAAGMDLRAAVPEHEPMMLKPMARTMVPTGLSFAVPAGFEAQVRPRSGLAAKAGITCLNTPGTIDADYRGEVKVILINLGEEDFIIRRGDRIAQLVIAPVAQASWREVASLEETARGAGGFGSTGAA